MHLYGTACSSSWSKPLVLLEISKRVSFKILIVF